MKMLLVDQGSGTKIMYPDLYKGLNLKPEDLIGYDLALLGFDGKIVIPRGQIILPVARPWLHALGAVSSTLYLKVKYPSGDQIEELVKSQFVAV